MSRRIIPTLLVILILSALPILYCEEKEFSNPVHSMGGATEDNKSVLVPYDERLRKKMERRNLENEGRRLAKERLFDEALVKFRSALDPALFSDERDKVFALCAICKIYVYQGKLDEALDCYTKYVLVLNPKKEVFIDKQKELKALIIARDSKSNESIYSFIDYIKDKYKKYLPPTGYSVTVAPRIDDLIHLYDYIHDYDSGIAFMDELIKYHTNHNDRNHRSAHAKDVKEYTRVKQAWELDKSTGQHGHLQEVIRTSDIISW